MPKTELNCRKTTQDGGSQEQAPNNDNCRDTPLSGKEKATPLSSAAETELPPCFNSFDNDSAAFVAPAVCVDGSCRIAVADLMEQVQKLNKMMTEVYIRLSP